MKILLGHKYFFRGGGTSTYLFSLMDYLTQNGHEPIPFSVNYACNEPSEYSNYFVSPPLGSEASHLKDMKITPLSALKLLGRATYSFEARRKARALIHDTEPDIAYLHNLYNYMSPSVIDECKAQSLPIVMRVPDFNLVCAELHLLCNGKVCHECVNRSPLRAIPRKCLKGSLAATAARAISMSVHNRLRIYDKVDLFITPSAFMRNTLIEAGYGAERVIHVPSFYAGALSSSSSEADDPYILYFGRISKEKAVDTLLRAYAIAQPNVRLLLAGGDPDGLTGPLTALAEELQISDRVEFLGLKGREELDDLISGSLFTVVPSRCYDNCPMSVLESFAHGKPVIGSNIGGIPEQITDGCGLLFAPDDAEDLAGCITRMLEDKDARVRMGEAAKQRLAEAYAPEKHCTRLLGILWALINGDDPHEVKEEVAESALCGAG